MQKIRTALLSYGMSGKVFHAPFLDAHPGFELTGAWERSHRNIQHDYPSTSSYHSFKELLADDVDLVVVNTPVATHFEYAQKALLAGKHVLVEKAFTANAEEAETLASLAHSRKRKLAVFQNRRWDSDFLTVKDVLDQKLLGDIIEAEFHFDRYNPTLSPKLHKESVNPGSGILKDLGPHLIDQALVLFGMPQAVHADLRKTRKGSKVDDYMDLLLYYKNKRVRLKAGFFVREAIPAFVLHGTEGSFLKPRGDVQEEDLKIGKKPGSRNWGVESRSKEGLLHTEAGGKLIRENIPTLKGNYNDFFNQLCESIVHDRPEPVTAADGVRVMKVIDAAVESNRQHLIIKI